MTFRSRRRPFLALLLAALSLAPSLTWCRLTWAEVSVTCLAAAGAAACAGAECGAEDAAAPPCAASGFCPMDGAASAAGEERPHEDDPAPVEDADESGRAWCPSGPLGGIGLLAAFASPGAAPVFAILPATVGLAPPRPAPPRQVVALRARPPTPAPLEPPSIRGPPPAS